MMAVFINKTKINQENTVAKIAYKGIDTIRDCGDYYELSTHELNHKKDYFKRVYKESHRLEKCCQLADEYQHDEPTEEKICMQLRKEN